ncbi:hypothetical protein GOP47_0019244 [Adiantum capillus-veneris]|uniref:TIR domain-containing protein n=1 Tax=Adiantum capillus-veneris TaxID=13818 RepID=A0A9D4UEW4_ADICA|nr:hypothetical protein GOP47_0019244 [Adiantum capillus-veneris]
MMQNLQGLPSFRSRLDQEFDGHPERLPKHKIFISHSGKQKDFAEQLCKDLEACNHFPFFDKRPHSLPKGQEFPSRIFKAASECFLAIVLLSEDFLNSKWPLLELVAFVRAKKASQNVQILPVLLGSLQPHDLKDTAKLSKHWKKWAKCDTRIHCSELKAAVRALKVVNMLAQSKFDGEVALRSDIVSTVLSMIPPDVRPDVSHVQGKEHLYKEIMTRFSDIGFGKSHLCKNARIVGVYGIAGVGKSTMCMVLAHLLNREFQGRVCHLAFGSSNIELQLHLALRQLTGASQEFVQRHINNAAEGWTCLKERMPRQRVFLALDNESDKPQSWEMAKNFLYGLEYHVNSIVLVTSRSKDVLEKVLGIPESCCMHCPYVTAEDAVKIVLDHNGLQNIEVLTEEQRYILHKAVEMCDFGGFHPMALKVLATQLGRNPSSWRLSSLRVSEASDREHMLFTQMETIFLRLSDEMRDMFMDIALFTPEIVSNVNELCLWLMNTLHPGCESLDEVREKVKFLMSVIR